MLYLLALIGAVTIAVLLWKAFGPQASGSTPRTLGPDDDPEFLWRLQRKTYEERRDGDGTDGPAAGT